MGLLFFVLSLFPRGGEGSEGSAIVFYSTAG